MSRGELLVVAGGALCAIGAGLWIAPGAGLLLAGVGTVVAGILELRFPAEPDESVTTDEARS